MGAPVPPATGPAPASAGVARARARAPRPPPPAVPSVRAKAAGVLTAPVTWLLVFLLIPLVLVAAVGFATVQSNYLLDFGRLTPENYVAVFNPSGEAFRLLWRSLGIAFGATVASLVVGYAMAYYIARIAKEKWRGILMALVVIPFWVTFIVRIYGLLLFVRPDGFVDGFFQTLGLPGVGDYFVTNFGVGTDSLLIFTLVYVWLPFMVLPLFTSLSKIDPQLLEAASDLGASRLRAFWNVTLPLSLPGIVTGSIFVFITTLGSFVEPSFLSAEYMIGNFVETQFSGTQGVGIPLGAAASVFIIISTMLLVTIYARYAELEESGTFGAVKKRGRLATLLRFVGILLVLAVLGAAAAYFLAGALTAASTGGILDAALLVGLLNLFFAYAYEETGATFRRIATSEKRLETTDAVAVLFVVAAVWLVGRFALFSVGVAAHGWTATSVAEILIGAVAVFLGFLALGVAGVVLIRNRRIVATQSWMATLQLLTQGKHVLGVLVQGTTRALDRVAERAGRRLLAAFTAIVLLVFFMPLILMTVFSFTAGFNPSAWEGFSFRWYIGAGAGEVERDFLFKCDASECSVLSSLGTSVVVGVASAFLSLIFGLLAAFAIDRYAFRGKAVLNNVMYLGLVIPSIVMGISLSILVRVANDSILGPNLLQWEFGLASLIVGHTTFNIPLATLVLLISFREFDKSLEEAAMNLGAGPLTTFFRVTLPNIKAGIVSTLLLTFTFSFDEFPVSLFLAGSNPTYPIVAWGLLSKKIPTPEANAAATLILVISLVFVLLANKVQKGGAIFRF